MKHAAPQAATGGPPAPRSWIAWVFALLCLGALVPVWAFDHWLTQDGPGHVYAARVLNALLSGPSAYDAWYEPALGLVPNLGGGALLALFSAVLAGPTAERILASLVVLGFCGGALIWVRAHARSPWPPAALLIPPLALNTTLYLGFYSYGLSLALLPVCWALASRGSGRAWAAAGAVACVAWVCHLLPALFCLAGMAVAGVAQALQARSGRPLLPMLLAAGSAAGVALLWRGVGGAGEWVWQGVAERAELTLTLRAAAPFVGLLEPLSVGMAVALGALAVLGWRELAGGVRAALAALLAVTLAVALAAPEGGPGFWYVGERVALIPWLAALGVAAAAPATRLAPALAAIAAVTLGVHGVEVARLQADAHDADAVLTDLAAGSTVAMVDFSRPLTRRFSPFVHYVGYAAARDGLVDLSNHEAEAGHFQLRYRPWVRGINAPQLIGSAGAQLLSTLAPRVRYVAAHGATDELLGDAGGVYRELRRQGEFRLLEASAQAAR